MRYTRNLNVREDRHMSTPTVDHLHPHDYQGRVPHRLPAQVIRELSVLQPCKAITAIVVEWLSILAAIALCEAVWHPLVYGAAVIWIGARQHALTVLGRDKPVPPIRPTTGVCRQYPAAVRAKDGPAETSLRRP